MCVPAVLHEPAACTALAFVRWRCTLATLMQKPLSRQTARSLNPPANVLEPYTFSNQSAIIRSIRSAPP